MKNNPIIEDINDFQDYSKKNFAQFYTAIRNIELAKEECIKNFDFKEAWKLLKLQTKFEILLNKKRIRQKKETNKSQGKN